MGSGRMAGSKCHVKIKSNKEGIDVISRKLASIVSGLSVLVLVAACSNGQGSQAVPTAVHQPTSVVSSSPMPTDDNRGEASETEPPEAIEYENKFDYDKLAGYEVVAEGLKVPWSIAADGDTFYISERGGSIVKLENGKQIRQQINISKDVKQTGESGFLGLVLSPDFSSNHEAFVYHTYESNGNIVNRIVKLAEKSGQWSEVAVMLEGIPGAKYHDGGRLAIGPDGNLYATTGDAQQPQLAQSKDSLAGKILRMSIEGNIPADNPFEGSYIYSYGHRNPQGLAWDEAGRLFETEHGPSGNPGGHDEINRIEAGNNFGWPAIIGDAEQAGMIAPLYHTGDPAIAPSGAAIDGNGQLLFTTLVGETLYRYDTVNGGAPVPVLQGEGRLRDVLIHNGHIYVITNNTDGRGSPSKTDDRLLVLKFEK